MTLDELRRRRDGLLSQRQAILDQVGSDRRDMLTDDETDAFRAATAAIEQLGERIEQAVRRGEGNATAEAVAFAMARSDGRGGGWAARAAAAVRAMGGESRAVVSGSVDVPSLVPGAVTALPHPTRIIDLLANRQTIPSNAYEFFVQSARDNNAAPVADGGTKPTSTLTVKAVSDRARVHAHLSEPAPIRLWHDTPTITDWLQDEMVEGVLDSIENTTISGDGTGEQQEGVLHTVGITAVAFDTDMITTLRGAVTKLQKLGEKPSGWVLSPEDAATIDLLRFQWGGDAAADAGFLLDGYQNGPAGSANVFGPTTPRVVSPTMPQGTAILADWSQLKLFVREDTRIDIDVAGDLFSSNQFVMRAEARVGVAVLRPQAFAVITLTDES